MFDSLILSTARYYVPEPKKVCKVCNKEKPSDHFYRTGTILKKTGIEGSIKTCIKCRGYGRKCCLHNGLNAGIR